MSNDADFEKWVDDAADQRQASINDKLSHVWAWRHNFILGSFAARDYFKAEIERKDFTYEMMDKTCEEAIERLKRQAQAIKVLTEALELAEKFINPFEKLPSGFEIKAMHNKMLIALAKSKELMK
jgi:hypothetical protein